MSEQNADGKMISVPSKRMRRKPIKNRRGILAGGFLLCGILVACGGAKDVKPTPQEANRSVDPDRPCASEETALLDEQQKMKPRQESFLSKLGSIFGHALSSKVPGGELGQQVASKTITEASLTPEERELQRQAMTRNDPMSKLMDCRAKHNLDPATGNPR